MFYNCTSLNSNYHSPWHKLEKWYGNSCLQATPSTPVSSNATCLDLDLKKSPDRKLLHPEYINITWLLLWINWKIHLFSGGFCHFMACNIGINLFLRFKKCSLMKWRSRTLPSHLFTAETKISIYWQNSKWFCIIN